MIGLLFFFALHRPLGNLPQGLQEGLQEVVLRLKFAVKPAQCPVPLSQHNWLMVNGIDYLHWRKRGLFWKGDIILWSEIARSPKALAAHKTAGKKKKDDCSGIECQALGFSLSPTTEWSMPVVWMLGLHLGCLWNCSGCGYVPPLSPQVLKGFTWMFLKCFDALGWQLYALEA